MYQRRGGFWGICPLWQSLRGVKPSCCASFSAVLSRPFKTEQGSCVAMRSYPFTCTPEKVTSTCPRTGSPNIRAGSYTCSISWSRT